MRLNQAHLAYCTNVHRGETWAETFNSLQTYTLAIRQMVSPKKYFGIGLRLGNRASLELSDPEVMLEFRRWLDKNGCYVFTINGFPYGSFHGTQVKDKVYTPDWTSPERLFYTNRLFDILSQLLPGGMEGSVSTLPGSFKGFHPGPDSLKAMRSNIWRCVEHIAHVSNQSGRLLHLGVEPEPLCLLESSAETLHFFERMRGEHPNDARLDDHLGVNYDTCHFAVEFEEPQDALATFVNNDIKISKIHLSSALKVRPTAEAREELAKYSNDVYLHQVVVREVNGQRSIYNDLSEALASEAYEEGAELPEWRIHFHVPLHADAAPPFENTNDHLLGTLDVLAEYPSICSHLEMETYTWEVLPPELKSLDVVDQIAQEYEWTLTELAKRGLASR